MSLYFFSSFFFNVPATTEIYTLSLHDALPISRPVRAQGVAARRCMVIAGYPFTGRRRRGIRVRHHTSHERMPDRKSTRLNSSHTVISYAVFCLKKKKHKKVNNTFKSDQHIIYH